MGSVQSCEESASATCLRVAVWGTHIDHKLCSGDQPSSVSSSPRSRRLERSRNSLAKRRQHQWSQSKPDRVSTSKASSSATRSAEPRPLRTHIDSANTASSSEHPSSATNESVPIEKAEPQKPCIARSRRRGSASFGADVKRGKI